MALTLPGCDKKDKGAGEVAAGPPEVLVTQVKRADIPVSKDYVASLDGSANATIVSRVQGYLDKQVFTNGSVVKTSETLFLIDKRPYEAALAQAKANLALAEAKQVETQLNENRQVQLFSTKAISEAERDQAVQANAAAKANVLAAAAAVEQAGINLQFCTVVSPIDGIAGIANPGTGDLVGPSTGAMVSISKVDPIRASIQISESEYLNSIAKGNTDLTKPGAEVPFEFELILANGSVFPHKGRLDVINRQFDVRTGTIEVRTLFPNPGNDLRPGFFAKVRIVRKTPGGVLMIPQRAVIEVQGNYQVPVVGAGNKLEVRTIQLGKRVGSNWIVTDGLKEGETVVVEGLQVARDEMVVNPKPFEEKAVTADGADKATTATKSKGK
ncbi:MAG: efflux RND transporter periplasmic adaptor subunit [Candidatus Sumerlaeaceae bacterium]|nr:efflux RND transporter periplasmic adaptor subunit [Candidatus Sumerlaeaceae bacterium]